MCRSQLLPKMETTGVPASTSDCTLRSSSTGIPGEARGAEGGQLGVLEVQLGLRAGEEFLVFRVGAGPAAFDVVDTQLVEFLRDEEFVVDGERDGFALRAVAESGVESEDFHKMISAARATPRYV